MKYLKLIFSPLKSVNKQTVSIIILIEIIFALSIWQIAGGELIPKPVKVFHAIVNILGSSDFYTNLMSSFGLTIKGMFFSIIIALVFSYLSMVQFFRPIAQFLVKCRYLTLTGLIFLFTLLTNDGSQLKISLLIFGIVPFFVTSLLTIFSQIEEQEFELCTTLRMSSWRSVWEVVIIGRLDQVFEVLRQNFAISWMMITMVEGYAMSEGGLGTMLIKANKYIQLDRVFAVLAIILAIGILFDFLLSNLRHWFFPYTNLQSSK